MRRFRPCITAASIASLLFLAAASVEAITPTPTPEPVCSQSILEGGGVYSPGLIEVALPEGEYGVTISPPGPTPSFTLCHLDTAAVVELRTNECEEVRRVAPSPEAEAVIDAIVGSCRLAPTPTPQPPPLLCRGGEAVQGGGTITIDDSIQVALPQRDFFVLVQDGIAQICNQTEQYTLALRLGDCGRSDISPPNAPAVLDQIASSCVLLHPVTPVPAAPPPSDGVVITPPSTGDAGLL